jgi:hypothetical protein
MVTIKIDTANAAFQDNKNTEVIRILRKIIKWLERDNEITCQPYTVLDTNGNTCCNVIETEEEIQA